MTCYSICKQEQHLCHYPKILILLSILSNNHEHTIYIFYIVPEHTF